MRRIVSVSLAAWALTLGTAALAQPAASRGQLLYNSHCIACHTNKMHWRDGRLASDWASLRHQVRRWQATAHLNWSEEDIDEVARFLNATFYGFPRPGKLVERVAAGRPAG